MSDIYFYNATYFVSQLQENIILNFTLTVDRVTGEVTDLTGTLSPTVGPSQPVDLLPPGSFLNNDNILSNTSNSPYFSINGFAFSSLFVNYNIRNVEGSEGIIISIGTGEPIPFVSETLFLACLLSGTKILTNNGFKLIDDLKEGESIKSENKEYIIQRIITTSISDKKDFPYLVPKGTILGSGKCIEDLYISRGHSIKIKKSFHFPKKLGFKQIDDIGSRNPLYYHIELFKMPGETRRTNTLNANGIIVESFGEN